MDSPLSKLLGAMEHTTNQLVGDDEGRTENEDLSDDHGDLTSEGLGIHIKSP